SADGTLISDVDTELYPFPEIEEHIKQSEAGDSKWFWALGPNKSEGTRTLLIYYKQQLLDRATGRLEGYLVGGLFLNDNGLLVEEIRQKTGAVATSLLHDDDVLAWHREDLIHSWEAQDAGDEPHPVVDNQYEFFISKQILADYFPDAGFRVHSILPITYKDKLDQLNLISALLGLALISGLSVGSIFFGQVIIIRPLKKLIGYARKVEKREPDPKLPVSIIREFNEVGRNLERVLSALQDSEKRFEDFASVTSDSIWETDIDNRYTFVSRQNDPNRNETISNILGKTRREIIGADSDADLWEAHSELIRQRLPFKNFIFERAGEDGEIIFRSTSGKPMFDDQDRFLGYRGTSSDITAEIKSQREAEKIQNQLRQSQKLEVVGQLTGGIAHDFNNLLAVVIGNLELFMEKEGLDDLGKKMLSDAMRSAEKGAALTHQLLAYSRQQALQPAIVRPRDVILGVESLLKRAIGESIELKIALEDQRSILVDPNELENALMNLVVNARDALEGTGSITIESFDIEIDEEYAATYHGFDKGNYACIVVTDTGSGIPKSVQDRVFEPFFTTKEVGEGSGLGLSMVFGFVNQSGGNITIYSEENKGTSIKLFLPIVEGTSDPILRVESDIIQYGEGELVLIVEDDEQVRELVAAQLQSIGYKTLECENGVEAMALLKAENIDVLLSDVILPKGMSGVDIAWEAHESNSKLPIVLMSGFTGQSFVTKTAMPEGVDVLFKPFTKLKLSEAISKAKSI
ncbi:MAG: ATP-binding protein, partial [Pseudomonas marincola]